MKTTIDIADPLMEQTKRLAARQGTTVKALVELGLRRVLADKQRDAAFRLRRVTFKGDGLQPGLDEGDWDRLRELAYEGRGT
jgi:Arc/MetJ family transcription regulator